MGAMAFRIPAMPHRAELLRLLGSHTRILSWATGSEDEVVAATVSSLAAYRDGQWQVWGWDAVMSGGWNTETKVLHWETVSQQHSCELVDPKELPGVFRERVQASTVMTVSHDLPAGAVELVARRSLGPDGEVTWLARASGGASLEDPATAAFVVEQTDLLRAEYDL